ncbi:MAG: phosphoenolpyruvate carboxykinase (ATP) [Gemmatimonadetes bacterium]|uniref:Phosphoenolpyruvate carboxykinase (ATP) n=1 Tax=Candidatus Kutchimonas denitrificans TaxID=3056748 RepID=A0AAE4ZBR3_9BACT|nr:phosphoenolpyruvate carboxykinase (ATP) [Gemmatimonadota bacterium]NIR76071.1 phosphoenolpyruvate carboxykinase (ATP) [Candidatus Kutchimonas denitrificans]NIS00450.1 phosphoenolpyruvate carboxykinase (ATP) [Gemmatimonadota bacterium]NIT66108.1 phosphoenolpyruvate carboxykinase (ATP) [Gemmatimonadota bacterium]NIU54186.1 phosphoenolpyruvate carboxykinase (ATP) [Gemmatimonadota bacterium]
MKEQGRIEGQQSLNRLGIRNVNTVWWNLNTPTLYEHALQRHEALLAQNGPLVVRTGQYTGRSPKDKYVVREPSTEDTIWWGPVNQEFDEKRYQALRARLCAYLQGKDLYVEDCYVGAELETQLPIRVITESAWHKLFARNMFLTERDPQKLAEHEPSFHVIHAPGFNADPDLDGTRSEVFVLVHFGRNEVIIGGTAYAGEIKKSMFTVMNYFLPRSGVLSMHCSANYGKDENDVALFFGLSGTGKTTLSADPNRTLIGDDEHGWSDNGVFNFEGGCYAKVIRLDPKTEPEIYNTTRMFGTILENVAIAARTRILDLDSDALTENTRASYPLRAIPNASETGRAGHPNKIIMLTCDAFGVLPPVARLDSDQAMYHFLSGYTAKVAGTERGVTEPQATFSACFGAPFLALHPGIYAKLLGERIKKHKVDAWLINTGWSGGPFGVGSRIDLPHTRAMVRAVLEGKLEDAPTKKDPIFGVQVPESVPDVPSGVLQPRDTWEDGAAYDDQARKLAGMFIDNFKKFEEEVSGGVKKAGPRAG